MGISEVSLAINYRRLKKALGLEFPAIDKAPQQLAILKDRYAKVLRRIGKSIAEVRKLQAERNSLLSKIKELEDTDARYYKVEALFPVETLKGDVFTGEELFNGHRVLVESTIVR